MMAMTANDWPCPTLNFDHMIAPIACSITQPRFITLPTLTQPTMATDASSQAGASGPVSCTRSLLQAVNWAMSEFVLAMRASTHAQDMLLVEAIDRGMVPLLVGTYPEGDEAHDALVEEMCSRAMLLFDPDGSRITSWRKELEHRGHAVVPGVLTHVFCQAATTLCLTLLQLSGTEAVSGKEEDNGSERLRVINAALQRVIGMERLGGVTFLRHAGVGWWPHRVAMAMHPLVIAVTATMMDGGPVSFATVRTSPSATGIGDVPEIKKHGFGDMTRPFKKPTSSELRTTINQSVQRDVFAPKGKAHTHAIAILQRVPDGHTVGVISGSHQHTMKYATEHTMPCFFGKPASAPVAKDHLWSGTRKRPRQDSATEGKGEGYDIDFTAPFLDGAEEDAEGELKTNSAKATESRLEQFEREHGEMFLTRLDPGVGSLVFVRADTLHTILPPKLSRPINAAGKRTSIATGLLETIEVASRWAVPGSLTQHAIKTLAKPKSQVREAIRVLNGTSDSHQHAIQIEHLLPTIMTFVDAVQAEDVEVDDRDAAHRASRTASTCTPMLAFGLGTEYPNPETWGSTTRAATLERQGIIMEAARRNQPRSWTSRPVQALTAAK